MFENRVKETGLSVSGLFFPVQLSSHLCLLAHHLPHPLLPAIIVKPSDHAVALSGNTNTSYPYINALELKFG